MPKFKLGQKVWVIRPQTIASPPCPTCEVSSIKTEVRAVKAKVSKIYTMVSEFKDTDHTSYQVTIDDMLITDSYFEEEKTIFAKEKEAWDQIKLLEEKKKNEYTSKG